jgi:hypothetical protein
MSASETIFRPARNLKFRAPFTAEHARALKQAGVLIFAAHAAEHVSLFGASRPASTSTGRNMHAQSGCPSTAASEPNCDAIGRFAQSQSGCLSCGSQLPVLRRQSATCRRLAGRPSFGGQRVTQQFHCLQASGRISGNFKGVGMQRPNINNHRQLSACSMPSASLTCLTWRSTGPLPALQAVAC